MADRQMPKFRVVVDIVFLLDVTKSMGPCIDDLRANINKFVDEFTSGNISNNVLVEDWRAKVVGYRDFELTDFPPFEDNPFVSGVDELRAQLDAQHADGGNDGPESLLDALFKVATMGETARGDPPDPNNWRDMSEAKRLVIVFTDAAYKPEMVLPEARGGRLDDVKTAITSSKVILSVFAPDLPCYDDLAMIDKCELEPIEDEGAGYPEALEQYTRDLENFEHIMVMLARTISQPISTECLGGSPYGDETCSTDVAPESAEPPRYTDENVQFTVYRPKTVRPAVWNDLLAFAHLSERAPDAPEDEPDPIAEVQRQVRQALGEQAREYQDTTQDSRHAVPRHGELTFVPEMEGVEFNPPSRAFRWEESVHREDFRFRASADLDGQVARGSMTVYLGAILLAEVTLSIRVDSAYEPSHVEPALERSSARRYRRIFPSYSHRDLDVVRQVEELAKTMGDRYLRDFVELRTGEVWAQGLEELIEAADVFQLFWSTNSMRSSYVRQEWEYALALNRPGFVRPTYWEDPMPTSPEENLPPEELGQLHFHRLWGESESHAPQPAGMMSEGEPAEMTTSWAPEGRSEAREDMPPEEPTGLRGLGGFASETSDPDKTRRCPTCGAMISVLSRKCRYCLDAVGRYHDEGPTVSIEDLGDEAVTQYVPSSSVMEALESFRPEQAQDGISDLDERSKALASLPMPPTQTGGGWAKKAGIAAAIVVVVVILLYVWGWWVGF